MADFNAKKAFDIACENQSVIPKSYLDWILQRAEDGFFYASLCTGKNSKQDEIASRLKELGFLVEKRDCDLIISWDDPLNRS